MTTRRPQPRCRDCGHTERYHCGNRKPGPECAAHQCGCTQFVRLAPGQTLVNSRGRIIAVGS